MTNEEFIKSISQEGEVWKDVPDYQGFYMASTEGRLISLFRTITRKNGVKQTMQPSLVRSNDGSSGYHYVTLCKNGNKQKIPLHRVIALTFLQNPENKPVVDHINGQKDDNRLCNLRWATYSENMNNSTTIEKAKLACSEKGKSVVCLLNGKLIKIYQYPSETRFDGFCPNSVRNTCNHVYSQHKGYTWMYIDEYNNLLKDQALN